VVKYILSLSYCLAKLWHLVTTLSYVNQNELRVFAKHIMHAST